MRYGALNQGGDDLASFGGFVPLGENNAALPPASSLTRYGDDQLYALARYLYSLTPPANPNKPDALSAQGNACFSARDVALVTRLRRIQTIGCFPSGDLPFQPAIAIRTTFQTRTIDTDPALTMETRRGTGYYKVPSLRGVWYRGPFEHGGRVQTLEDWFDPARVRDDYRPTGFNGRDGESSAVRGHEFGLQLGAEDKRALIAFLKTL